jgi:ubiquinone/menaquinone biosynthesis C-methylase UbiE
LIFIFEANCAFKGKTYFLERTFTLCFFQKIKIMQAKNQTPAINLPPIYDKLSRHEAFPEMSHDEKARYNFLANLNRHLSTTVAPGNKIAFEKRVAPQFQKAKGRDFETRDEVREAMLHDTQFQTWSALRRATMELRQQAGRALVLRQIDKLAEKTKRLSEAQPHSLTLNKDLKVPHYLTVMDNHCMPGSYHTELIEGDVSAAANYDTGLFVTTAGGLGKLSDGGGKAITQYIKTHFPDFRPKRILDIGCGLGHNTLPLATAFPDAEVIGLDVAAPMLRYGHARAMALGVKNVKFVQMNAENLSEYTDGSFDWVQTTMFLHETSTKAMYNIGHEIHRILRGGGLSLHIEQPQYSSEMPLFEQFIRDWDAFYNNEPFWGAMHDIDVRDWMATCGFKKEQQLQFGARAVNDNEDHTKPRPQEIEDHGRSAVWNVFGAWK